MKTLLSIVAASVAVITISAPVFAETRVIASPGITLTESAQAKFNRDTGRDNRQILVMHGMAEPGSFAQLAASAGLTAGEAQGLTLGQVFVAKINRENGRDQQQLVKGGSVSMSSRSAAGGYSQLAAGAGLTPDEAAGLTLNEIAIAKFNRDTGRDNRQGF